MKTIKFLFSVSLILLFSISTFGKPGEGAVKGKLTDLQTSEGVPFASISLKQDSKTVSACQSDIDGYFVFKTVPPGKYEIEAFAVGYNSKTVKGVVVVPASITEVNIAIEGKLLQDVVIQTNPFVKKKLLNKEIKANPQANITVDRSVIQKMPQRSVEAIASTVGGVSVAGRRSGASIRGSRANGNIVYIDGVRVRGSANLPMAKLQEVKVINGGLPASYGSVSEFAEVVEEREAEEIHDSKLQIAGQAVPRQKPAPIQIPVETVSPDESYAKIVENSVTNPFLEPLSTFSIDVDVASYANARRMIHNNQLPPANAVRAEEFINYFKYDYPQPKENEAFGIYTEIADCPWNKNARLVQIGIKGKEIPEQQLPPSNFVFLVDVSGSMSVGNKLPLAKDALKLLVKELKSDDKVAMVVYAGNSGLALPSTSCKHKSQINAAIDRLESGGSTAGAAGIQLAYQVAKENFLEKGNNRVILITDGDFNVGVTSNSELEDLIASKRKDNIFLSVMGFGMDNYKDDRMEMLADKGNGNYAYIDSYEEAKKVFQHEMTGNMYTIAKDVKIQVEFNPAVVKYYRLIGYEDRLLNAEDFNNDNKDAGEIGSGQTVTALYEVYINESVGNETPKIDALKYQFNRVPNNYFNTELLTVKIRHKQPMADVSELITKPVLNSTKSIDESSDNFKCAAAAAGFAMLLRNSAYTHNFTLTDVKRLINGSRKTDPLGSKAELAGLVTKMEILQNTAKK